MVDYNTKIPIIPSRYDPYTMFHSPVTKLDSRLKDYGNDSWGGGSAGMTTGECGNNDGGVPNVGNLYTRFSSPSVFAIITTECLV